MENLKDHQLRYGRTTKNKDCIIVDEKYQFVSSYISNNGEERFICKKGCKAFIKTSLEEKTSRNKFYRTVLNIRMMTKRIISKVMNLKKMF